ncbi:hypothetical protein SLS53_005188 [Cytospora paraplurivora]|uniref:N-acetyltransferase domain-containing protein n=1 Tax=Cytospora paraplurivora TaxID=2898453 RepID=A0AAN9U615_9PEZI
MGDLFVDEPNLTTEDVVFAKADLELQKLAWRLNGEAWAAPISIDDYIAREYHLSQQDLSKEGRCTYWVLTHKDDPTHVVASCESFKKTVFIAGHGTGINNGFLETTGYVVASVYTNPRYRRLGMAAYMLQKLQEHMDTDSECSVLYSDIGKLYYANLGWDVFPSDQATIYLQSGDFSVSQPAARYLTLEELMPLCDQDVAQVKTKFQRLASDHHKTHVAFSPSYAQISWLLVREQFMAGILFKREIERRGAISSNGRSWIYWEHDWRGKQLKVLKIVNLESDPETGVTVMDEAKIWDIVELLQAAAAEAAEWGLQKVLLWNPDDNTTRGIKGFHNYHAEEADVVFDERNSSIPSLRWKGGRGKDDTIWEDNYYYCWC